jgi:hypothetical protein
MLNSLAHRTRSSALPRVRRTFGTMRHRHYWLARSERNWHAATAERNVDRVPCIKVLNGEGARGTIAHGQG